MRERKKENSSRGKESEDEIEERGLEREDSQEIAEEKK